MKYSRILWEGVKLEEIKIDIPYAKQNLRERWPDTKFSFNILIQNFPA